jgi:tRNA(Ile)-lysidine synthase
MLTFFLKELLERNFSQNLTFNDFTSLKNLISKQTGRKLNLSSGLIVYKERKEIIICRNSPSADKKMDYIEISAGQKKSFSGYTLSIKQVESGKISPGKDKTCEFISADDIFSDKFIIRTWQSGDRFIPIGMNGSKKVSDFLNEIKMESNKKKDQFLLLNGKKIVWVIGKRLDDRFKINKDTKKVLELCLKTE